MLDNIVKEAITIGFIKDDSIIGIIKYAKVKNEIIIGRFGIKKFPGILNKLHVSDAESGLTLLKSFPTKIHVVIHKTIPLRYVIPFKTVQLNILAITKKQIINNGYNDPTNSNKLVKVAFIPAIYIL
tara:strand:+ start:178 stop:558 length:381 start_codon:yes stop_codon:yes gene_type:complete